MILSREILTSKEQTGAEMHRLINSYYGDLEEIIVFNGKTKVPMSELSIKELFELVKNLPYAQDTAPIEVVSRPSILMQNTSKGLDCKKKAILIASYLKYHDIPYRLIASSKLKNGHIHHVFPQMNIGGTWCNMDATYDNMKPFEPKQVTRAEVI